MKIISYLLILLSISFIGPRNNNSQLVSTDLSSLQQFSDFSDDINNALRVHNDARADVGVKPVVWSSRLAKDAEEYATKLAKSGRFVHSNKNLRTDEGENLYWYSSTHNNPLTEASESWYDEIHSYKYRKCCGRNFGKTGHYTQMVWETTTEIGIGVAVSKSGETYVVARYNPAGNFQGRYPY